MHENAEPEFGNIMEWWLPWQHDWHCSH